MSDLALRLIMSLVLFASGITIGYIVGSGRRSGKSDQ